MTRKNRRWALLLACGVTLAGASTLSLAAFRSDIVFFVTSSQLEQHPPAPDRTVRLGGMVVAGSLARSKDADGTPVARFGVTDGQSEVMVSYAGILPDLFREGQSVVALGTMRDGRFTASEVLAKHSETYMPKDVADALKRSGKWDPRYGKPPSGAAWAAMTGDAHRS